MAFTHRLNYTYFDSYVRTNNDELCTIEIAKLPYKSRSRRKKLLSLHNNNHFKRQMQLLICCQRKKTVKNKKKKSQSFFLSIGGGNKRRFNYKLMSFPVATAEAARNPPFVECTYSIRVAHSHVYFYNFSIATKNTSYFSILFRNQNSVQYCITWHYICDRNNC